VSPQSPTILDAPEHRPIYLTLPARNRIAWITFLGFVAILAAVALPRIGRAERELRIVAVQALATNVRSAALSVNITWRTSNHPGELDVDGRRVTLINGYPSADSIDDAIWDHRGFVFYPGQGLFAASDVDDPAACSVRYQPPAQPDAGPGIAVTSRGC
jgi:hypothetical protein